MKRTVRYFASYLFESGVTLNEALFYRTKGINYQKANLVDRYTPAHISIYNWVYGLP